MTIEVMRKGYSKNPGCKKCSYFYICDGEENSYVKEFGFNELKPIIGEQIRDPLFYRKEYISQWT